MTVSNNIKRFYKGNLTLMDVPKEFYNNYGDTYEKEKMVLSRRDCSYNDFLNDDESAATERIGLFKNMIAFAEIITYKGRYLRSMSSSEREEAIKGIISDLPYLYEAPVGYEVKDASVIVCFILNDVCHSCEIDPLISSLWRRDYNCQKNFDLYEFEDM